MPEQSQETSTVQGNTAPVTTHAPAAPAADAPQTSPEPKAEATADKPVAAAEAAKPAAPEKPQEQAKPAEQPAQKPAAPAYEIKAPEGFEINPQVQAQFVPLAQKIGLTQEQVQPLVEMYAQLRKQEADAVAKEFEKNEAAWKADPAFSQRQANVERAVQKFLSPEDGAELRYVLALPKVRSLMERIGVFVSEGRTPVGMGSSKAAPPPIYPNSQMNP